MLKYIYRKHTLCRYHQIYALTCTSIYMYLRMCEIQVYTYIYTHVLWATELLHVQFQLSLIEVFVRVLYIVFVTDLPIHAKFGTMEVLASRKALLYCPKALGLFILDSRLQTGSSPSLWGARAHPTGCPLLCTSLCRRRFGFLDCDQLVIFLIERNKGSGRRWRGSSRCSTAPLTTLGSRSLRNESSALVCIHIAPH